MTQDEHRTSGFANAESRTIHAEVRVPFQSLAKPTGVFSAIFPLCLAGGFIGPSIADLFGLPRIDADLTTGPSIVFTAIILAGSLPSRLAVLP